VEHGRAVGLEDGAHLLDERLVPPDEHRELAGLGRRAASGHARVDQAHAAGLRGALHPLDRIGLDRAVDQDDGAFGHGLEGAVLAEQHGLDVGVGRDADREDLGVRAHLAAARAGGRAAVGDLLDHDRVQVVDAGVEALGREVPGHRAAHVSESDVADALCHWEVLSFVCGRTAAVSIDRCGENVGPLRRYDESLRRVVLRLIDAFPGQG
jgi:hypothetical protein